MDFNPEMLMLARHSRRMTQKQLAASSDTAQSAISKAEAGAVRPVPESVTAWAKVLRYPEPFFSQRNDAPPMPRTFFRKRASMSQTDIGAIRATISIQCMHVEALARSVELDETDVPKFRIGVDIESAAEAARFVRSKWMLKSGPIPNIVDVVEDHSIVVVPMQEGTDEFMGLSVWEQNRAMPPVAFVRAQAPSDRIRWTIAHELGHIVLHHHQAAVSEECEDEADEFASEFLMPASDIKHHFSSDTKLDHLAQLKLHWRVSMQTLLMRGKALGRISDSQSTRLWKQISFFGYRRNEPNPLAHEAPGLLKEMVRVHVEELEFTEQDLCSLLLLEQWELEQLYQPGLAIPTEPSPPSVPRLRLV